MKNIDCINMNKTVIHDICLLGTDDCSGCRDYRPESVEKALDAIDKKHWFYQEPYIREIIGQYLSPRMVEKIMQELANGRD